MFLIAFCLSVAILFSLGLRLLQELRKTQTSEDIISLKILHTILQRKDFRMQSSRYRNCKVQISKAQL